MAHTLTSKLLRKLNRYVPSVRVGDLIPIDRREFWKRRSSPVRSLCKTASLFNETEGGIIVEIGTGLHGRMSGNSILIWAEKQQRRGL